MTNDNEAARRLAVEYINEPESQPEPPPIFEDEPIGDKISPLVQQRYQLLVSIITFVNSPRLDFLDEQVFDS